MDAVGNEINFISYCRALVFSSAFLCRDTEIVKFFDNFTVHSKENTCNLNSSTVVSVLSYFIEPVHHNGFVFLRHQHNCFR